MKLSLNQIAWLIPVSMLIHQLEEYFAGFAVWYSDILDTDFSSNDFILINSIALIIFLLFSLAYNLGYKNQVIFLALGTLLLINGVVHTFFTLFMLQYSPGTISGIILFIPLGIVQRRKLSAKLSKDEMLLGTVFGIIGLLTVSVIAYNT